MEQLSARSGYQHFNRAKPVFRLCNQVFDGIMRHARLCDKDCHGRSSCLSALLKMSLAPQNLDPDQIR
jgi:hypothetical protein